MEFRAGEAGKIAADFLVAVAPDVETGKLGGLDEAGVEAIVQIVGVVGDFVGEIGDLGLEGGLVNGWPGLCGFRRAGAVLVEALEDLEGEIEAGELGIFCLDQFHDAEALLIVIEAAMGAHEAVELGLAGMAERGVAEIVGEGDGLREVLIEGEGARDRAGDGGDLDGMGEAGAEVIGGAAEEDLGLVLEPAEGAGMDDPGAIPLVLGSVGVARLAVLAAGALGGLLGVGGEGREFLRLRGPPVPRRNGDESGFVMRLVRR